MYNQFFGFKEKPFEITADPRFLYLSESHKEGLAHLIYAVQPVFDGVFDSSDILFRVL